MWWLCTHLWWLCTAGPNCVQRLNHFPGMLQIARKKGLARNLAHMRRLFPEQYTFSPPTFLLPEEMEDFLEALERGGAGSASPRSRPETPTAADTPARGGSASAATPSKGRRRRGSRRPTWILKLDNGSQGRGIKLVQTPTQALSALPTFEHGNLVASLYLPRPLLVNGFKFDLRIYVLVRCCDPLRVFIYREVGGARGTGGQRVEAACIGGQGCPHGCNQGRPRGRVGLPALARDVNVTVVTSRCPGLDQLSTLSSPTNGPLRLLSRV